MNRFAVLPSAELLSTNETIHLIPLLRFNSRSENSRKILSGCRLASVIVYNGSNLHSGALISVLSSAPAIRLFPESISSFVESFQMKRKKEMTKNNGTHIQKVLKESNWRGWIWQVTVVSSMIIFNKTWRHTAELWTPQTLSSSVFRIQYIYYSITYMLW